MHGYRWCFLSFSTVEIKVNVRPDFFKLRSIIETGNLNHGDNLKGVKFELISK